MTTLPSSRTTAETVETSIENPIPEGVLHDFSRGRVSPETVLSYLPRKDVYTVEDLELLPESAAFRLREGRFVVVAAPRPEHQEASGNLFAELRQWVRSVKLGKVFISPIDVRFSPTDAEQPDIVFVARERLSLVGPKRIQGAPDLVVEILSPSTAYDYLWDKKQLYEKHGVREYWIVDTKTRTVEVHALVQDRFQLIQRATNQDAARSRLLDGFEIALDVLFDFS